MKIFCDNKITIILKSDETMKALKKVKRKNDLRFDIFGTCKLSKKSQLINSNMELLAAYDYSTDFYILERFENIQILLHE